MRNNQPVTQREYTLPEGITLMSSTDAKGRITYANAAFVAASGFSLEELMGQPHNMVRHPDMPPEAFADMWASLQAGRSWTALVKNRRKDGDHYWVRANATPIIREGQLKGYVSVRTQPTRHEVSQAETLYRAFREKRQGAIRLYQGLVVRTGWLSWMSLLQVLSVRSRIRLGLLLVPLLTVSWCMAAGHAWLHTLLSSLVATLAVDLWLGWQISQPLAQISQQADRIASGQATSSLPMNRVDDIGMIARAIDQSGLNLQSLIADVNTQIGNMQTASAEIAAGNNDLSNRTEKAAANLQATAASIDQMASAASHFEKASNEAASFARSACTAAAQGGQAVAAVMSTMDNISHSSHKIADITGVIDSIAFQTNILALNAAVEAARAGEQGSGFAVVAGEVRALAKRSADAARQIKSLIEESSGTVAGGAALVTQASQAMTHIAQQVGEVSNLIEDIHDATTEQSTGIQQVNHTMGHLDQLTQQNAALVEQAAAAAGSLHHQAERLAHAVGVFR